MLGSHGIVDSRLDVGHLEARSTDFEHSGSCTLGSIDGFRCGSVDHTTDDIATNNGNTVIPFIFLEDLGQRNVEGSESGFARLSVAISIRPHFKLDARIDSATFRLGLRPSGRSGSISISPTKLCRPDELVLDNVNNASTCNLFTLFISQCIRSSVTSGGGGALHDFQTRGKLGSIARSTQDDCFIVNVSRDDWLQSIGGVNCDTSSSIDGNGLISNSLVDVVLDCSQVSRHLLCSSSLVGICEVQLPGVFRASPVWSTSKGQALNQAVKLISSDISLALKILSMINSDAHFFSLFLCCCNSPNREFNLKIILLCIGG